MKIEIPEYWLNKMANAHESLNAKDVAELVSKTWGSDSKRMLNEYIGGFVMHQILMGKYEKS